MPIYNLGMLTAGLPNPMARQASGVVTDPAAGQANYLADWQSRYDAAQPVWTGGGGGGGGWTADFVNANFDPGWISGQADQGRGMDAILANLNSDSGGGGGYDDSARRALDAEKAQQLAMFAGQFQNQQTQQSAYNTAGGGSYLGGLINASYATPQTGLDPNSSLNGMLNTQPWSMPGFGGPTGVASQSGFGTPNQAGTQPQGWGGPFTNRNPWSAS